ncbi:MAG: hypothetical protein AAF492_31850, partial [Verrucomicrobiota bacterium]
SKTIVPGPGVSSDTTFETNRFDGLSRLTHAEDDDATVTFAYDSLSRVIEETLNGQTTLSAFDGVGNKLSCVYPGGRSIQRTFDRLERPRTVSDGGGLIVTNDYVGRSRIERREFGNGTRTDYTYSGALGVAPASGDFGFKQLNRTAHTRISDGHVLDDRTYTWDRAGNKTRRADVRAGGPTLHHDYHYDSVHRLIRSIRSVAQTGPVHTDYTLDGVDNRLAVTGPVDPGVYVMTNAAPEPADAPMNQYSSTPFDTRLYDTNGNLVELNDAVNGRKLIEYD